MNTFTVFLLLMVSIVPVVMIVFGYLFSNRPPKKVGSFLGYRTSRSILNEDTWRFAHHYCGKTWFVLGWLTLALTIGTMWINADKGAAWLGDYAQILLGIQILPFLGGILLTEYNLRQAFTKDGRRRKNYHGFDGSSHSDRRLKRRR